MASQVLNEWFQLADELSIEILRGPVADLVPLQGQRTYQQKIDRLPGLADILLEKG